MDITPEKKPTPDAEQLCKILDLQLAESRARRASRGANRNTIRIVGLLILVLGSLAALWVLMTLLDSVRPQRDAQPAPADAAPR